MEVKLKNIKPDVRRLYDMEKVIYDKKWLKKTSNSDLYYMYRGIKRKGGLRYDITIVPAKMLGSEFVKTKGHEHIGNYGEIYIVLEGKAIYLMQKRKGKEITDVFAIKAKKGDVAIIPSGYGHITINPSKKDDLKMANWMADKVKSDYTPILKMEGACYYYIEKGWIKNKNYKKVPKLRFKKARKTMPKSLDFLRRNSKDGR